MSPSSYRIETFIEKVKGHSYHDIIHITDQEATRCERRLYQEACRGGGCEPIRDYVGTLKDFILYMRYGVRTSAILPLDLKAFELERSAR
ncbi:MAG: hypothetical protein KFF50_17750 [Desulfatitalea sp.]|nr:hypothetical protein [Desulfatitalea sp.]